MKTDFWQNHKWLTSFLVAIAMLIVIVLVICCGIFLNWLAQVNKIVFMALVLIIVMVVIFRIMLE